MHLDPTPKPGLNRPGCFAPQKEASTYAMLFVDWPTIIQEPYQTLSLQAIDTTIKWWKGKPAPRASPLRARWSLSPNLQFHLRRFLRQWHLRILQLSSPLSPTFVQNRVCQTFCRHGPTLQPQTSNRGLIRRHIPHVLLSTLVLISTGRPESNW